MNPINKNANNNFDSYKFNTRIANKGRGRHCNVNFINPALSKGSTILFDNASQLKSQSTKYKYALPRIPLDDELSEVVNDIEGSEISLFTNSGLSAVTIPLLAFLNKGDHLLITDCIYNNTRNFIENNLPRLGIEYTYYNPIISKEIEELVQPNTKVVYIETPGSNTFEIADIPTIISSCQKKHAEITNGEDLIFMADNTWATGYLLPVHKMGVDISFQATTKYYAGHGDMMGGIITAVGKHQETIKNFHAQIGVSMHPDDLSLTLRSLRTFDLRLKQHQKNALKVAEVLDKHPKVKQVFYPALASHPQYEIFKRDFKGASGTFSFSFHHADQNKANQFIDHLKLFGIGLSWGSYYSLAIPLNLQDIRTATNNFPKEMMIRLSIGLEDHEDLTEDLLQALDKYG